MIKSRQLRRAGYVAWMEEGRCAYKILTGKITDERPLGRPRRRWEDNIIIDLKEIFASTRNWIDSAQDRDYWSALANAPSLIRYEVSQLGINKHLPIIPLHFRQKHQNLNQCFQESIISFLLNNH